MGLTQPKRPKSRRYLGFGANGALQLLSRVHPNDETMQKVSLYHAFKNKVAERKVPSWTLVIMYLGFISFTTKLGNELA